MVLNAIKSRQSVRKYSDKPISDDVLNNILEAGRLAPSWVNVQPWKFIVVKSQATKDLLAEAAGRQAQVKNAQIVICCIADLDDWSKTKFGKVLAQKGLDEVTCENIVSSNLLNPANLGEYEALLRSVEQLTYAVSYMTLAAEEQGVGCCIVGAMANELTKSNNEAAQKIKDTLGLNNKQVLVELLTLGYNANPKPAKKFRKEAKDIIFYEKI